MTWVFLSPDAVEHFFVFLGFSLKSFGGKKVLQWYRFLSQCGLIGDIGSLCFIDVISFRGVQIEQFALICLVITSLRCSKQRKDKDDTKPKMSQDKPAVSAAFLPVVKVGSLISLLLPTFLRAFFLNFNSKPIVNQKKVGT